MKIIPAAIIAVTMAAAVGGCVDDRYGHSYGSVAVGYGGYYDDYYGPGPFYDGYWGGDGVFYFSDGPGRPFRRDEARHFRHEGGAGFHAFHGNRPSGGSWHHREHEHD